MYFKKKQHVGIGSTNHVDLTSRVSEKLENHIILAKERVSIHRFEFKLRSDCWKYMDTHTHATYNLRQVIRYMYKSNNMCGGKDSIA